MEKYLIFNKHEPLTPLSMFDKNWNGHIMELSLKDAKRYVEEQNQKYGEDLFFFYGNKRMVEITRITTKC